MVDTTYKSTDKLLISQFIKDPYNLSVAKLVKLGKLADDAYYNSERPILTDTQYDLLREIIKSKDPTNKYLTSVGSTISKNKIQLPYVLGSATKPNSKELVKFLEKFKTKYPPPYIISEKLDGISALTIIKSDSIQMMTKGDSKVGTNISNLVPYFIKHDIESPCDVRGEIIMSKKKFKKYEGIKKNPRNTVSGFINAKTLDKGIKDCEYLVYEMIKPWLPFDEQFTIMGNMGFKTVKYELVDDLNVEILLELYRKYVNSSDYECDGIIVSANSPGKRDNTKYPDYMFAFKSLDDLETAEVTVKQVVWQISKDGYIKPVITFDPVMLGGVENKRVTSHNAKYIFDNSVGPGAVFTLVRSGGVIPYIKGFIKGAKKPQMPDNISWSWNFSGVDIITDEYSEDQKVKELVKFFTELGIEHLAIQNVKKLIAANIDTIPKIVNVTQQRLTHVENFKDTMIKKIHKSIHEKLSIVSLPNFMVATNIFGHGLGKRLLGKVFKTHPDIVFKYIEMNENDFRILMLDVEDFGEERTNQFIDSMEPFLELFSKLPNSLQDRLISDTTFVQENTSDKFLNRTFVFSGPRSKEWETMIENGGGKIGSSVSSKTFAVISTTDEIEKGTNSKIKTAKSLPNCKVFTWEQFTEYISE